jgi:hypothetical protein
MNQHQLRNVPKELGDDDDAFETTADGRKVLKPGRSFRIGMMDHAMKIGDGRANFAANRPGWRIDGSAANDAAMARRKSEYQKYDAAVKSAYTGFGSASAAEFRGDQPGDLCTVRGAAYPLDFGSAGHLNADLVCVPDNPKLVNDAKRRKKTQYRDPQGREEGTEEAEEDLQDSRSARAARLIRDAAYDGYNEDLTTAWKGPINDHTPSNKPRPANTRSVVVNDTQAKAYADYDKEIAGAWKR